MRTSADLADAAKPYAKQSFRRNASWNELNQQQGMYFVFNRCFQQFFFMSMIDDGQVLMQ